MKAENRPVMAPDSALLYIIHTSEEITPQVKAEKRGVEVVGIELSLNNLIYFQTD
jgi:hypothetical protein